ncbi:lysophospholipid acyltransferase family protein [Loktanella agnita]|uniref:lysophospholipid acyltransferase family protein n=1 Tax=Loktanella agnita TaxID=287097 RepID=UPI003988C7BF
MSLRHRLENSQRLAALVGGIAGRYLAFCNKRIRWTVTGEDALKEALAEGPVLLVTWHECVLMAALHWPVADGPLSSLFNSSPIGRVAGAMHRRIGLKPVEMSRKTSNLAASRIVLKRVHDGFSIGIAADGPVGPLREMKDATLEWARVTNMPVFTYGFATSHGRRLDSWDKMRLPYPKGHGAICFARYSGSFPRKPDTEMLEAQRRDLQTFLTQTTEQAEATVEAKG